MVAVWPRQQAQTKAAVKKVRPMEEKVLGDVRKRVSQIKKILEPAVENAGISSNITKEAEQTAYEVAKVPLLLHGLPSLCCTSPMNCNDSLSVRTFTSLCVVTAPDNRRYRWGAGASCFWDASLYFSVQVRQTHLWRVVFELSYKRYQMKSLKWGWTAGGARGPESRALQWVIDAELWSC